MSIFPSFFFGGGGGKVEWTLHCKKSNRKQIIPTEKCISVDKKYHQWSRFYFCDSQCAFLHHTHLKNIPTKPMGENHLISDGKRHPSPLMENANNLSKNFDASVTKIRPPSPTSWESDAILKDSVQNKRSEKKKQREKETK
jgi:hypothetical protein